MRLCLRHSAMFGLATAIALLAVIGGLALRQQHAAAADATITAAGSGAAGSRFTPNVAPVSQGGTVNFQWGSGTHTATAVNGAFNLSLTSSSVAGTWKPTAPGTYYFYCAIHSSAALATDAHVQANDSMVGVIVVAQAPGAATPTPTPSATPAPSAPDFTQFGFATVGGSLKLAAGQGGTVTAGGQSVVIDPATFTTDVTFELLVGNPSSFTLPAGTTDRVISSFAFRVTGPTGLVRAFAKPVHYSLTSPDVIATSRVFNGTATNPPSFSLNTGPNVINGRTLGHDFTAAAVGWVVTSPIVPAAAKTGQAGFAQASNTGAATVLLAAALALAAVVGGRLVTGHKRQRPS